MVEQPWGWLAVGFAGQALFSARFLLQWVYSERRKRSIIPVAFWYFSLAGGATLFIYALHIGDPVFILGQSMGVLIYTRNLYFIHKQRQFAGAG
ncbi:MAG: lipid-A-disaccharide synthase N-terminal domain-containing protein [Thiogranum sp.]|jgi:lipid-A-disaccharide synthase-like uncharacterized protein